ncbi:tRNA synthetases class I family protein, partial [Vibrio parahaemolyticus V-223/04]
KRLLRCLSQFKKNTVVFVQIVRLWMK